MKRAEIWPDAMVIDAATDNVEATYKFVMVALKCPPGYRPELVSIFMVADDVVTSLKWGFYDDSVQGDDVELQIDAVEDADRWYFEDGDGEGFKLPRKINPGPSGDWWVPYAKVQTNTPTQVFVQLRFVPIYDPCVHCCQKCGAEAA